MSCDSGVGHHDSINNFCWFIKKFLSNFPLELSLTDPIFSARALDSLSPEFDLSTCLLSF
ncbi:hypothetical protein D8T48_11695 [Vibrio vulnificus]|nr:hypothetical protein D8T48_11695 [Vibrio vulnificus]